MRDIRPAAHPCVLAVTAGHWDHYRPGTTVRVDAWLERCGDVETLPRASQAALTQVVGTVYDFAGVVTQIAGELAQVGSVLPIQVDLDPPAGVPPPPLAIGDSVRVRGVLKIEFRPDGPA